MSGWDEETEPDDNDKAEDTLPESLPLDLGSDLTHSEYDSNDDSSVIATTRLDQTLMETVNSPLLLNIRESNAYSSLKTCCIRSKPRPSRGKEHSNSKSSKQKATPGVV
jgi:hypothetical protein